MAQCRLPTPAWLLAVLFSALVVYLRAAWRGTRGLRNESTVTTRVEYHMTGPGATSLLPTGDLIGAETTHPIPPPATSSVITAGRCRPRSGRLRSGLLRSSRGRAGARKWADPPTRCRPVASSLVPTDIRGRECAEMPTAVEIKTTAVSRDGADIA